MNHLNKTEIILYTIRTINYVIYQHGVLFYIRYSSENVSLL